MGGRILGFKTHGFGVSRSIVGIVFFLFFLGGGSGYNEGLCRVWYLLFQAMLGIGPIGLHGWFPPGPRSAAKAGRYCMRPVQTEAWR